jgi:hypothetical protein
MVKPFADIVWVNKTHLLQTTNALRETNWQIEVLPDQITNDIMNSKS